jgi:DNA-binding transcriptional LysR family regulator
MEPVRRFLAGLREDVFGARTFSPGTDTRSFRVGISDQAEAALMQDILHAVRGAAPGVRIIARSVEMRLGAELLAAGAIDLAIGYFPEVEAELEVATLYHETFVCLFDAEACGICPPVSLDDYTALPHILVSLRGEPVGHLDELLQRAGRSRFVVYTTPHFLAVPFLLHGFRAIAAVPRRLAENCADAAGLSMCPVPLPSDGYDVRMAWHRRTASDPAQTWLRTIVADIGQRKHP